MTTALKLGLAILSYNHFFHKGNEMKRPNHQKPDRQLSKYEVFIESEMYIRRSTLYVEVQGILGKLEIKRVPYECIQDLVRLEKFILKNFSHEDIKVVASTWDQNQYKIRFWDKLQKMGWDREDHTSQAFRTNINHELG